MREITDLTLCELKTRFVRIVQAVCLYELFGALMSSNTKLVELKGHINALYPAMVDADLVAAQLDVVRHIYTWLK